MTRGDIQQAIFENLQRSGIGAEDIGVQPDPFGGWRIAAVASAFERMSPTERKAASLDGLEEIHLEWIDLLTPGELEWSGPLPTEEDPEQIPLWPESLARGNLEPSPARFPSDLDEDLALPFVTTFYSLRDGVGRFTALAYAARILAHRGRKVVCVDMDLEAPGLAALFGLEGQVRAEQGIVAGASPPCV